MDLAMGAMGSLLGKLGEVIKEEYKLQKGVKKKVKSFSAELDIMRGVLAKVAEVPRDQLDELVKLWANDVRELSYDMEDVVDSLLVRVEGCEPNSDQSTLKKFVTRFKNLFKKGKARREISTAVEEIHQQLQDLTSRHKMFDFANLPAAKKITLHPFWGVFYGDKKNIIGLEEARDDIINKISDGDDVSKAQLKILSIVGFGGLGKTTLAREVYDALTTKFDYKAFVSVSRNPDMKKVLSDLLFKLDKKTHASLHATNLTEEQLIILVQELLSKKRYFFVVDDIWHEESWELIKNILIENEHDNVVVTTTRIPDIAAKANEVYKLTTLSHSHSEELFNTRLFGGKGHIPSGVPKESETLVRACGGVPLAIITMAVLLAGKPIDCWSKVREDWFSMCKSTSFSDQHQGNDHIEDNTSAILLLIYYELPGYLRTFLLHLSIFPENYAIQKETLIWKWVAEGLVDEEPAGKGLFEKGEIIFGELIHSSLIMPIVDSRRQIITGCRLHGLVLDMIRTLSTDVNFVTVLDGNKQPNPTGRRIAVQMGATEKGDPLLYTAPERLRSFYATGFHFETELPLAKFGVVRVLALEECTFFKGRSYHLKHLRNLHMLRYLGLYNTPIDKLPEEVCELIYLQTLDLRGTTVKELTWGVAMPRELKCLRTDQGTAVSGMFLPTSLEELRLGRADFAYYLRKLTELRELEICIEKLTDDEIRALGQSIRRLGKIKVLRLLGGSSSSSSGGEPNWEHFYLPRHVRELHISTTLFSLPSWIDRYHSPMLSHLSVNVEAVEERDLHQLGRLPELISLEILLPSHIFPTIMGGGAFPKLRCFHTSTAFSFSEGAMPRLEFLHFKVDIQALKYANVNFDDIVVASTLKNLRSIKKVEVEIISTGDVEAIHEALKRAVDQHPNSPSLHVVKTDLVGTMYAHRRLL